ncbi:S8 family peptidase [Brevibacillus dissolubilis]|uniref:S8 family peptidase n=1 Tax=Brevibacillus dissolubilis TaxID=1844116 RepID=UPI001116CA48|nr:S8 family peptidase [Brevibacillus dissolubilis]
MFGFSMIQTVRRHSAKLDRTLRTQLLELYRPFRWVPCIFHRSFEGLAKRFKRHDVIIEFHHDETACTEGIQSVKDTCQHHSRCVMGHELSSVHSCSAKLTANALEELLTNCSHIKKIHTDRQVRAFLDVASPSIGAHIVNRSGLTGNGVTIAILDTGIHPHPDLTLPTNRIVAFRDFVNDRPDPYDDNGHGTHCAGDAAGNGLSSDGIYQGPAPEARLVGVKVLNKVGSGSLSTIMAGVQWCIDNRDEYSIDIISMSLGTPATTPAAEDPLVQIVERAWISGIVVCVAAGNEGPEPRTVASPGISPRVITVGAMDDQNTTNRQDDQVADFSSRGPTIDGLVKPDLLAPGVNIVSLRAPNSYIDKLSPETRIDDNYTVLSGTSMATPICAGVVALLLQKYPTLTPFQVKRRLMMTADNWGLPPNTQGQGYLNAEKAVR